MNEERLNEWFMRKENRRLRSCGDITVPLDDFADIIDAARDAARERNELETERDYFKKERDYAERAFVEAEAERDALHETHTDKALAWDKLTEKNEQIAALRVNNAALREALEKGVDEYRLGYFKETHDKMKTTLASTPADSLTEYRNGVLSDVEKIVEEHVKDSASVSTQYLMGRHYAARSIFTAIRAMRTDNDAD